MLQLPQNCQNSLLKTPVPWETHLCLGRLLFKRSGWRLVICIVKSTTELCSQSWEDTPPERLSVSKMSNILLYDSIPSRMKCERAVWINTEQDDHGVSLFCLGINCLEVCRNQGPKDTGVPSFSSLFRSRPSPVWQEYLKCLLTSEQPRRTP